MPVSHEVCRIPILFTEVEVVLLLLLHDLHSKLPLGVRPGFDGIIDWFGKGNKFAVHTMATRVYSRSRRWKSGS